MEKQLAQREYLAGEYSIADMACYPWTVPYERQGIDFEQLPHVQRWSEAVKNRPAVIRRLRKSQSHQHRIHRRQRSAQIPFRADRHLRTGIRPVKTVVLTGAGISAESGLSTFRGEDGLWDNEPIEEVATPEGFHRDPARVHRFYNARRKKLGEVRPNDAHRALADFEARHQDDFLLITQNVDDLHERAGSHPHPHARRIAQGALRPVRADFGGGR